MAENWDEDFIVECWYCLGEYDAPKAAWCGHPEPSKICPYCLNCSCNAPEEYKKKFWDNCPPKMKIERVKLTSIKEKLGEILIAERKIVSEQLLAALNIQKRTGEKLGEILVKMGLLSEQERDMYLLRQKKVASTTLADKNVDMKLVETLGLESCLRYKIVPFFQEEINDILYVHLAMANPYMPKVLKRVAEVFSAEVIYYQTDEKEMDEKLKSLIQAFKLRQVSSEPVEKEIKNRVLEILHYGLDRSAEYIYLEQEMGKLRLNLRIDGTLFKIKEVPLHDRKDFLERVKRFVGIHGQTATSKTTLDYKGRKYVLKFSVHATSGGENLAIRVADLAEFGRPLIKLHLSEYERKDIAEAFEERRGVVVVSAPIFNDSSSLVYTLMDFAQNRGKVMSFERDLSKRVVGVTQMPTDGQDEKAFLDDIYRMEPDIVFFHDLKSPEVAAEIFRLSKNILFVVEMYAKSSTKTVLQLSEHLRISPETMADSLRLVINQRLVRILCDRCKSRVKPTLDLIYKLKLPEEDSAMYEFYREKGCPLCNQIGFKGRTPLYEVLKVTGEIKAALRQDAGELEISNLALAEGMIPLAKNALTLLSRGVTSVNEVIKQGFFS